MRKGLFVLIPLLISLMACATTATITATITAGNGMSEIVIIRDKNDGYVPLAISIDGENKGTISSGGEMRIRVPNGKHTITGPGKSPSNIAIELNDDLYVVNLEVNLHYDKLTNGKQTKLPSFVPQEAALKISDAALALAIDKATKTIIPLLKDGSKIAVVSIAASSTYHGEFVIEELAMRLVNTQKYTILDRKTLDSIRKEQHFQITGEVDDDTIISIGKFAGAGIVITGSIDVSGSSTRLRIKALDVRTAQVIAMSSEQIR